MTVQYSIGYSTFINGFNIDAFITFVNKSTVRDNDMSAGRLFHCNMHL